MKECKILEAYTIAQLEEKINEWMRSGYELYGFIVIQNRNTSGNGVQYIQTMVKHG
jgi:hypothetical protein